MRRAAAALFATAAAAAEYDHDAPLRAAAPTGGWAPMSCEYTVRLQEATLESGAVPVWLNGSYYHAAFETVVDGPHKPYVTAGNPGGVVGVYFRPGEAPRASFNLARGSAWHQLCRNVTLPQYACDGVVTVNGIGGDGTVAAVTGQAETTLLDGATLDLAEAPTRLDGGLGAAQNVYPAGAPPGPAFMAPAHMATDANGDVYGFVYVYDPAPAYRVYRVRHNTRKREVLTDLPAHPMFSDADIPLKGKTMAYGHQAVAFTPSYILLPEMPVGMSRQGTFDWKEMAANVVPGGELVLNVLDKATGKRVGAYSTPACNFTWHNINAWENATHIGFDFSWQVTAAAGLKGFTDPLNFKPWDWRGRLARVTMPNPAAAGAPAAGAAELRFLTPPSVVSPEFGAVNPAHMWLRPCRYVWAAATTDAPRDQQPSYWPELVRIDTWADDGAVVRYSKDGWQIAEPSFVPRSAEQGADSADGVVVLLMMDPSGALKMSLVDGATMQEVALLSLPIKSLPSIGLHNHWGEYPASA